MRSQKLALALVAGAMLTVIGIGCNTDSPTSSYSPPLSSIKVVNYAYYGIEHLYISPSTSQEWGQDLIPEGEEIPTQGGTSTVFNLEPGVYDLRASVDLIDTTVADSSSPDNFKHFTASFTRYEVEISSGEEYLFDVQYMVKPY